MGVEKSVNDEVVLSAGSANKCAGIIDHRPDALVLIWVFGMQGLAKSENGGIDLNGIDAAGTVIDSGRYVVSRSAADNEHVSRCRLEAIR